MENPFISSLDANGNRFFFLLGAGASVDSGLPTYRGAEGLYNTLNLDKSPLHCKNLQSIDKIWKFISPLYKVIQENQPGQTYQWIRQMMDKAEENLVVTQNIDGYCKSLGSENIVELHGSWEYVSCLVCGKLSKTNLDCLTCECGGYVRPNIVLVGEHICENKHRTICTFIKKKKPTHMFIIGTTMQFKYLDIFLKKAKLKGCKVLHINPEKPENMGKSEYWIKEIF